MLLLILIANIIAAYVTYRLFGREGYIGFLFGCTGFWTVTGVTFYGTSY